MDLQDQVTVMYDVASIIRVRIHSLLPLFQLTFLFQAYMYGFFKNKRIVLYDTLIQQVQCCTKPPFSL
jgi:hypothetical protein